MKELLYRKKKILTTLAGVIVWFVSGFLAARWWADVRLDQPGWGLSLALVFSLVFAFGLTVQWGRARAEHPVSDSLPVPPAEAPVCRAEPECGSRFTALEIAGVRTTLMELNRSRLAGRGMVLASPYQMGLIWTDEQNETDLRILVHLTPQGNVTVNEMPVEATHDGISTGILAVFHQLEQLPMPEPQPVLLPPLPLFRQLEEAPQPETVKQATSF
ncbi:MAG: hypothetical protein ABFD44_11360 [Anaerolineaceae bacterium]